VLQQINYSQHRDAGYKRDNLVFTFVQGDVNKNFDLIKHDLLKSGAAVAVTRSASPITKRWSSGTGYQWAGSTESDQHISFVQLASDADFVKATGVTLLEGRDIDVYNYPTDSTALLLNEVAVKTMGLKNPLGQIVKRAGYDGEWHVIGVVKNFILESPYANINPTLIAGPTQWTQVIHFKLNPANPVAKNLASAEKIFRQYNPQYPFEYVFADESYAKKFQDEKRTGTLAGLFAGLSIFISCLGLFGLATYMAESRIKEIGVRKVLGAGVTGIAIMLSSEFLKLVFFAFIIASPVAWYAMHQWLQNYIYRVDLSWWVFGCAGVMSVLIACVTVSYQAMKAALANPVKSLRSE
jgi:ABC-type antimicrobial peptide transport system permease subunit